MSIAERRGVLKMMTDQGQQLFVPEATHNIISLPRLQNAGLTIIMNPDKVEVLHGQKIIATGESTNTYCPVTQLSI